MELPKNSFKAALKAGERQIGLWITIPDSGAVEMLAACGYDWLMIDTEHSALDAAGTLPLLQAAAAYPVSTGVRPGWNDPVEIKRVLDCGAQTLLVPYVQTAEEARAAVRAVRYPPAGIRGVAGATRASRYGMVPDYNARAEEELCLLVQAETVATLDNLEEIAAVDGVDGIFVGPADLAASMGYPGQTAHPEVRAAVLDAIRRITASGKPAGILALDPGLLQEAADAGAQFIAVGIDAILLRQSALSLRDAWR